MPQDIDFSALPDRIRAYYKDTSKIVLCQVSLETNGAEVYHVTLRTGPVHRWVKRAYWWTLDYRGKRR